MTVEVLLSCMYQSNTNIVERSNLKNIRTLVINQCDVIEEERFEENEGITRIINTNTRGLSISRNMALSNAHGEICVISDDDEIFIDGFEEKIAKAYKENPEADVIVFNLSNRHQKLGAKKKWLRKYDLLRVASWQITFRTSAICGEVFFDEKLGAGTGNGGGEENKFLFECRRKKKKILYIPENIATGIEDAGSTWFFGYDEKYFYKLGAVIKYLLGFCEGLLYCLYTIATKYKLYKQEISRRGALKNIIQGFLFGKLE